MSPASRWVLALVVTVAVGIGIGYGMESRSGNGEQARGPAIELARELGLALPVEQRPAFADGVITTEEVEAAIDRFVACVEAAGGVGFRVHLGEDGSLSTSLESGDFDEVNRCRIRHFEATYAVWWRQGEVEIRETAEIPLTESRGDQRGRRRSGGG